METSFDKLKVQNELGGKSLGNRSSERVQGGMCE